VSGDYSNPKPRTQEKINLVAAEMMDGEKKKDAMAAAGYSESNRKIMPAVKQTIREHLERIGLTDEELAIRIKAATECKTPLSFKGELTGEEIPDNRAQIKALELAAELMGHRPGREYASDYDRPVNIQVNFGGVEGGTPLAREAHGFTVNLPGKATEELPSGPDESPD